MNAMVKVVFGKRKKYPSISRQVLMMGLVSDSEMKENLDHKDCHQETFMLSCTSNNMNFSTVKKTIFIVK